MDIKDFAQEFHEVVRTSSEESGIDYDEELAKSLLEYIEDNGEVNAPELCSYKRTRSRLTAYDYNDEAESLDLFFLIKGDSLLSRINNNRVQQGFRFLMTFYKDAISGRMSRSGDFCEHDEIVEVSKLVESTKGHINQLRLYIITDGMTEPDAALPTEETPEFSIEYNVWDMQRIYQQDCIRAGKQKVEIDFVTDYNTSLQCLKMSEGNPVIDAYLAIISGATLAHIYKQYQQVLLEKNVRTFLQFKGKVNKAIRNTLRTQPDMFFSYNNGISSTASDIQFVNRRDGLYITKITNWQIVNGGQTTASIAMSLTDKDVDLSRVFVPMKISVIKDEENSNEIVKNISTSANSQTAIKSSDFSANDPFLINLEKFSRMEWVPNGNNKPVCKWFFERTRGQYIDQLAQLSGLTAKAFTREYPKGHKITKTDVAKYVAAWEQRPYDVCKGAEKNYQGFVARVKQEQPIVNETYYRHMIAKAILFNSIDRIVRSRDLAGYKANMNAYLMSSVSFLSNGLLDFDYIWEHQRIQPELEDRISLLIQTVWNHLESSTKKSHQDIAAQSKKSECWNSLKYKLGEFAKFDDFLLQKDITGNISLNETQQSKIDEAAGITPEYWFELAAWAKSNGQLTPIERKEAFNYGTMKSRNKKISTLKQAQTALKIIEKAKELGFEK